MKKHIQVITIVLIISRSYACSQNGIINNQSENPFTKYKELVSGTLGTYALPPRLSDGQIDMDRLIAELTDIHANTYNWLVRNKKDDLDALKQFLPLAKKAKIKLWVTLVPPSEPPPQNHTISILNNGLFSCKVESAGTKSCCLEHR